MKPFRGAGFRESRPLERIKEFSWRLGFQASGAVSADFLKEEEERLDRWLAGGMHGTMAWMERNRGKRLDPRQLMEGAKTVIVVLQNYFTRQHQEDPSAPVVSKYAYGRDYHPVMKAKLKELLRFIQQEITPCQGRVFVDSAPVLERAWAGATRNLNRAYARVTGSGGGLKSNGVPAPTAAVPEAWQHVSRLPSGSARVPGANTPLAWAQVSLWGASGEFLSGLERLEAAGLLP